MVWPFNKDEMGEDARDYVAENCKEGVDPRGAIEDWGDYAEDYNPSRTDDHGTTYSSAEEVQEYYDSGRSTDIRINERSNS